MAVEYASSSIAAKFVASRSLVQLTEPGSYHWSWRLPFLRDVLTVDSRITQMIVPYWCKSETLDGLSLAGQPSV